MCLLLWVYLSVCDCLCAVVCEVVSFVNAFLCLCASLCIYVWVCVFLFVSLSVDSSDRSVFLGVSPCIKCCCPLINAHYPSVAVLSCVWFCACVRMCVCETCLRDCWVEGSSTNASVTLHQLLHRPTSCPTLKHNIILHWNCPKTSLNYRYPGTTGVNRATEVW